MGPWVATDLRALRGSGLGEGRGGGLFDAQCSEIWVRIPVRDWQSKPSQPRAEPEGLRRAARYHKVNPIRFQRTERIWKTHDLYTTFYYIHIHCTQVDGPVLVLKHRCALLRYEGHHFEGTALVEFPHKERFSVRTYCINFMERIDAYWRWTSWCFDATNLALFSLFSIHNGQCRKPHRCSRRHVASWNSM